MQSMKNKSLAKFKNSVRYEVSSLMQLGSQLAASYTLVGKFSDLAIGGWVNQHGNPIVFSILFVLKPCLSPMDILFSVKIFSLPPAVCMVISFVASQLKFYLKTLVGFIEILTYGIWPSKCWWRGSQNACFNVQCYGIPLDQTSQLQFGSPEFIYSYLCVSIDY